jgi:nitrilase
MDPIRVAVVQAGPFPFDLERTLSKARDLIAEAAGKGGKLVVFPEAFVGGYPKGIDFGARVGSRSPEGRAWFRRYFEGAIDVPGPDTEYLAESARSSAVWLVIGVIERDGGTLYCTVLFFSPEGLLVAKHRKLMPTAMERLIWGFGDGSTLPVLATELGRIGAVICWENYMPLLRAAMYAKGVQLYCAPTVDDRETWPSSMRHIAMEGRCFVLSACQFIRREAYPADYDPAQGNHPETVLIRGGSLIVDPLGKLLAGPCYDAECILTADLDLGEVAEGKYDLDTTGHYARPDIFRLEVNQRATAAVEFDAHGKIGFTSE